MDFSLKQPIPFYKKLLSYFYAVKLGAYGNSENPVLDLYLYRNRFQLATTDALYSDGNRYRPMITAFEVLRTELPHVENMLLLGGGMGSAMLVLDSMKLSPSCTMIELDPAILRLATVTLPVHIAQKLEPLCADAAQFMAGNERQFDLVVVDVFKGRRVPDFVQSEIFLQQCSDALGPKASFVLNYIVSDETAYIKLKQLLGKTFPGFVEKSFGINKVFIGHRV